MEVSGSRKGDSMMRLFRQSMSFKKSAPADGKQDEAAGFDRQDSGLPPLDMAMLKKAGSKSFSKKVKESFKKTFTPRNSLRKSLSGSFRGSIAPSVESSAPSTASVMSESPVSTPKQGSPVIEAHAESDVAEETHVDSSPRDSASDYAHEGLGKHDEPKADTPQSKTPSTTAVIAESPFSSPKPVPAAPAPTEDAEVEPALKPLAETASKEIEEDTPTLSAEVSPPSTPVMAPQTPEVTSFEPKLAQSHVLEPVLAVEKPVEHVELNLAMPHISAKPVLAVEGPAALAGLTLVEPDQAQGFATKEQGKKRGFPLFRIVLGGIAVAAAVVMGARVYGEQQPKKQTA